MVEAMANEIKFLLSKYHIITITTQCYNITAVIILSFIIGMKNEYLCWPADPDDECITRSIIYVYNSCLLRKINTLVRVCVSKS